MGWIKYKNSQKQLVSGSFTDFPRPLFCQNSSLMTGRALQTKCTTVQETAIAMGNGE